MIFAAVDIGSNAARLLFANVFESNDKTYVEKATLVRIPTRLGEDVYTVSSISQPRADNLIKTLQAFKLLIDVYDPVDYDACATAAMREADNGLEVLERIRAEVGLNVRLIDGIEEANIIRRTNKIGFEQPDNLTMYIDVGGGSTDISIMNHHEILDVQSFRIGTLRMLKGGVKEKEWERLDDLLRKYSRDFGTMNIIGSGGNINKINKLYGDPASYTLNISQLKDAYFFLKDVTLEDRIDKLGLRPDRADVIVPAAEIFLFIMNIVQAESIMVPKIGLADGLVYQLYEKYKRKEENEFAL